MRLLFTDDGYTGRVVIRTENTPRLYLASFLGFSYRTSAVFAQQSMRLFQEGRLKDTNKGVRDLFLLFHYEPRPCNERSPTELLLGSILPILGEPSESGVSMDKRWQETRDYLNDYYCLLKGFAWTVWQTQSTNVGGKQLRIMMTAGRRRKSTRVVLATHFQISDVQTDQGA